MLLFPNAKINLGLEIIRKRKDGFHDIDSVFYPIPLCDALEMVSEPQSGKDLWHYSGLAIPGRATDNLCNKALALIRDETDVPKLTTYLHKAIPMGAGLGGGSANGSFFIKGLNELFNLNLSLEKMEGMALELGSDCPFFIRNSPARATGRGEELTTVKLDLKGKHLLVICSEIHVSTKKAYAAMEPDSSYHSPADIVKMPIERWKDKLRNRFEEYAFEEYPRLAQAKEALYKSGAIYASMTGSGSAIYAISDHAIDQRPLALFGSLFSYKL